MKLGLGITTTDKRALNNSIETFLPNGCELFIHTDNNRLGVSKSRNNCIKTLYDRGCDYICIMDDDVRIMYEGWFEYIVDSMEKAGVHMSGLPSNFHSVYYKTEGEMSYWNGLIGAVHIFTRKFVEEVGYFNTAYKVYGAEDGEMQSRARWSRLIGRKGMPSALRAPFYLHSEDVYHLNPAPTLSQEEKSYYIYENSLIYKEAIRSKKIFYPYEQ